MNWTELFIAILFAALIVSFYLMLWVLVLGLVRDIQEKARIKRIQKYYKEHPEEMAGYKTRNLHCQMLTKKTKPTF